MNKSLILAIGLCICFLFIALHTLPQNEKGFSNPILAGFYPDPSICRVGSDYYLVTSSFSYYPGIPIFQSKDLVNWKLLGHVLDRPEQLNLDGLGVSRGIFAPSIRHHNGKFYTTCTLVDAGGNFIVTSASPNGPWSNPVWIPQINGIDPSPYFDDDGKAYILYNSIPPDDKSLYNGHRTIRMYEFDPVGLKVIGEEILLINGGVDITKKPVWIEAPHIFKTDGTYFLIAAEGGTADQHSEVVFKSTSVKGPYRPYAKNPILTQRHLDPQRNFPITSTGHADFVETETGDWWAVFLGCRPYKPYEDHYYNTGRETFLAPVKWIDGWPIINPGYEKVQYHYPSPIRPLGNPSEIRYSGNFRIKDNFDSSALHPDWIFLRTPREKWYDLSSRKGYVTLSLRPERCSDSANPSFIGRRQPHTQGSAAIALEFTAQSENEKAGLLVFHNEKHFYYLCKSANGKESVVQLFRSSTSQPQQMDLIVSQVIQDEFSRKPVYLKVEAHGPTYSFLYSFSPDHWMVLKEHVDGTFVSTRVAGGFVGTLYALYATSMGKPSTTKAYFDWYDYQGNDEVYQ
ncbi:MAG: glycoside hydrolase family 43 protein [bacterium]